MSRRLHKSPSSSSRSLSTGRTRKESNHGLSGQRSPLRSAKGPPSIPKEPIGRSLKQDSKRLSRGLLVDPIIEKTRAQKTSKLKRCPTEDDINRKDVTCAVCIKQYNGTYDCLNHPVLQLIRECIIGSNEVLPGPYGFRGLCYCDYTASGRPLSFIEDYIRDEVMPFYANTHTEASATGRQTNKFREDARELVLSSVGGQKELDAVIFVGSGSTGAIDKLASILNLCLPPDLDRTYNLLSRVPREDRPVIFIGPYEHHSNELIWRESIADVITIPETYDGTVDEKALEQKLEEFKSRKMKIGSFSAASNVTGIRTNVHRISALLHKYGALACWDYAAAAPYVAIDMNYYDHKDPDGHLMYLDAVYISPHKFVGGPGTPGVLCVKRHVVNNSIPTIPGGGTVTFVSRTHQEYDPMIEHREEGGTPAIIESIRCGLVFQLKDAVTPETIEHCEKLHIDYVLHRLRRNPRIIIMGNPDVARISILSMNIAVDGLLLHYNFVVALLNDLFGIQSRGGCSCAGPYGMRLFGLTEEMADGVSQVVQGGLDSLKPGWFRVNLNYFFDGATVRFICDAIEFIAEYGWQLLPDYQLDKASGMWSHKDKDSYKTELRRLHDLKYGSEGLIYPSKHHTVDPNADVFSLYLAEAKEIVDRRVCEFKAVNLTSYRIPRALQDRRFLENCFFHLPHTAIQSVQQGEQSNHTLPWWAKTLTDRPYDIVEGDFDTTETVTHHSMHRIHSKAALFTKSREASPAVIANETTVVRNNKSNRNGALLVSPIETNRPNGKMMLLSLLVLIFLAIHYLVVECPATWARLIDDYCPILCHVFPIEPTPTVASSGVHIE